MVNKTLFPVIPVPKHAFLPFLSPQGLGPRGKVDRYEPSHEELSEEEKYSPRKLGEVQHTSSLLRLQKKKKKSSLGSLSHQKWLPSDLSKRTRCPVWGGGTGNLRARLPLSRH